MGEGREDWKLRITAKIAAKIKDGVEDCKFICLKRDVVVSVGGKRKGKRGWTYVARCDEREGEHFCVYFSACPMPKHNRYRQQKTRG